MSKETLLAKLDAYEPFDGIEAAHVQTMQFFLKNAKQPFVRQHEEGGHVTASCFVASPDFSHVLLNRHGSLGRWLNFGGHCDGVEDTLLTATKELEEESGLSEVRVLPDVFRVDVHSIPAHTHKTGEVPLHLHYDVSYLAVAPLTATFSVSNESTDIRWFPLNEAEQEFFSFSEGTSRAAMLRTLKKVRLLQQNGVQAA